MHVTGSTTESEAWTPTPSFLTALPSTPFAIVMPDEFSDATDIIGDRRYLISTSPTMRQHMERLEATTWLEEP